MRQKKKLPFYFSIDFEDFYFDSLRALKIHDPESREQALRDSYKRIKEICEKYLNNKKITFFVTGVLCRKMPELIKNIHDDGHEIGCHYNFHDNINISNREEFAKNLDLAIESIEKVVGYRPLGFRAPNFAIDPENIWAYQELSKRFVYDSSYKTSENIKNLQKEKNFIFKNHLLREFFIFNMPIFSNKIKIRSGGTFLRLFSKRLLLKSMKKSYEFGHIPLIYMHPYEMTLKHEFWISWKDLRHLDLKKRVYTWIRQIQWSHLGHKSVENKIKFIWEYFEHQGPMKQLIE